MMIATHSRLVPLAGTGSESPQPVVRTSAQPDTGDFVKESAQHREIDREASSPKGDIATAVNRLNKQLEEVHSNLHFSIHEASGRVVVKVIDTQTEDVIRQIPSEAILALAENAENMHSGRLLDEQV